MLLQQCTTVSVELSKLCRATAWWACKLAEAKLWDMQDALTTATSKKTYTRDLDDRKWFNYEVLGPVC